jgi:hypothetical protein
MKPLWRKKLWKKNIPILQTQISRVLKIEEEIMKMNIQKL